MTLSDVLNQLYSFDSNDTIYVKKPWTPGSEAIVATEPDDGGIPDSAAEINADYFLEIFITNEFLEDWLSSLAQRPSVEDICSRVIQYAKNDA